jgi:hypothetical protein
MKKRQCVFLHIIRNQNLLTVSEVQLHRVKLAVDSAWLSLTPRTSGRWGSSSGVPGSQLGNDEFSYSL